jgi:hypothetical protein
MTFCGNMMGRGGSPERLVAACAGHNQISSLLLRDVSDHMSCPVSTLDISIDTPRPSRFCSSTRFRIAALRLVHLNRIPTAFTNPEVVW